MPEQAPSPTVKNRFIMPRFILFISLSLALLFISLEAMEPVSTKAPDVTFTTITGKKIVLKDLRGKPVIVTFWATDCPACIKEVPQLIELYSQYHKQGLEIIAVAMYYDPPNHVVAMTKDLKLPYHVALDLKAELAHAFGDVQLIPSTILITPDGLFALKKTGAWNTTEIKTHIKKTFTKG